MAKKTILFPDEILKSNFNIKHSNLDYEVISCTQAANAKNILVKHELKSIFLETSSKKYKYVVVHMRGDRKVNLRSIKNHLRCKEANLCSPKKLNEIGLAPGKVCPLIEPTWSQHHLISNHIFNLKYVSTNDGTRTGYLTFSPKTLLLTNSYEIGLFSTPIS